MSHETEQCLGSIHDELKRIREALEAATAKPPKPWELGAFNPLRERCPICNYEPVLKDWEDVSPEPCCRECLPIRQLHVECDWAEQDLKYQTEHDLRFSLREMSELHAQAHKMNVKTMTSVDRRNLVNVVLRVHAPGLASEQDYNEYGWCWLYTLDTPAKYYARKVKDASKRVIPELAERNVQIDPVDFFDEVKLGERSFTDYVAEMTCDFGGEMLTDGVKETIDADIDRKLAAFCGMIAIDFHNRERADGPA